MQENLNSNKSELWSLSLRDLFYKYVRFLPIFVLSVALALFVAYAYLRYATPIYSVGGTLYIKSDKAGGRSDKFEDIFVNDKALNIQSEIEVLRSRPLMQRVVDSLQLQVSYYSIGKIKSTNIYKQGPFLMGPYKVNDPTRAFTLKVKFTKPDRFTVNDSETSFQFGDKFANSFGEFIFVKNTIIQVTGDFNVIWQPSNSAAGGFAGSLAITPKTLGTGILSIGMQTANPTMGADVINKLMDEYATYTIEEKNKASDQTLSFIEDRLILLGNEIDSIQNALLVYSQKNNLIDIASQSGAFFDNVSELDKTINKQQMELNVAVMLNDYLADKRNEFKKIVVPSSFGLADETLNSLVDGYNKSQLERQRMIDGNVPLENPLFKEKNGEIEKLRVSVLENLSNIRRSISAAMEDLKKQSYASQSQLQTLPYKAKEYNEIKRQVETKQALFKLLQEKKEETAISRAANIPNSKVIDKAVAPSVPVKPNKRAIQIMAILLGLGLPAMVIFIGEVLNDKVSTRFDIEKITPAPILGEVGHSYSDKALIVNKTTRSMVAEQFRIIRSNLQYILNKNEKSVILVSSSFSGEGKSFISTNMAAVLALAGKKTIILEFDIRKPKVLSGLGMPKGPGITNFLVGKGALEDLIRPVDGQENLFVMGCGPVPPNPSELLLDKKVEEMFVWLRNNFDMIIVDTAPVGMVSDAMTLGKFADCTLYLVRQGHTFKKQVALIDEFYQDNKLPKVSIIINDVKMKPGYGYYGYGRYGYGYGYGYGSYYEEEHPPQTFFEKLLAIIDFRKWFKKEKKIMRILVTGGAGFIGSNLVAALLNDPRVTHVRVLDNLATGALKNITEFKSDPKFQFIEGDIRDYATCQKACEGIDRITHQAALGSVPRSINDPLTTNEVNITGTLNIFTAAKEKNIQRVVYAASSSTYGDHPGLPKVEDKIGNPLSPYAVTKYVNELYAKVYASLYGIELIGLRYFNIFGPKQNPAGAYAAVIPLFAEAILTDKPPTINGDGHHSRDFTYVENAVQANILSLFTENTKTVNQVYNIACGHQTSLNDLFDNLKEEAGSTLKPIYGPERMGDVKHSLADISKAKELLGYDPKVSVKEGLKKTFQWYLKNKN